MSLGLLLVIVSSANLIHVLTEFGKRTAISPFCISFIFAPFAIGAESLILCYKKVYSGKGWSMFSWMIDGIHTALLTNTGCAAILFLLVWLRGLPWRLTPEVCVITGTLG